jgi:predicted ester cyclase
MLFIHDVAYVKCQIGAFGNLVFERCIKECGCVTHAASVGRIEVVDCTPVGDFMGLPVNGRKVQFSENVFYRFREGRIIEVWSVIDKAAAEAQL